MGGRKSSGIKSAVELALERLARNQGPVSPLSAEQKQALAEVESRARAQLAETEILMASRLAAARASGEPAQLAEVEEQLRADRERIRRRAEDEKERIRRGTA